MAGFINEWPNALFGIHAETIPSAFFTRQLDQPVESPMFITVSCPCNNPLVDDQKSKLLANCSVNNTLREQK